MGKKHPLYGKHHTKEAKEKMSKIKIGKHHTEKTKKKMSIARKGKNHPYSKKVICIETGEIFDCIKDAAEKYNIYATNITKCCKGKYKTSGKKTWRYLKK